MQKIGISNMMNENKNNGNDAIKQDEKNFENGINNIMNDDNNGNNNDNNKDRNNNNTNTNNYSASRTSANEALTGGTGLTNNITVWIILAVAGAAIVLLVWYYAVQNKEIER